jgi:glycosyltransferase involved in cell wall biosynthesis
MRILEEIQWLRSHGHDAWIGARAGSKILDEGRRREIPSLEVNLRSTFNPASTLRLFSFIRKNKIEVVNTHSSKDAWHGAWLRILGSPVVRTRHMVQAIRPGLFHRLVWTAGCDHIIAAAGAIQKQLIDADCGPEPRISVVGEWIDPARFRPQEPSATLRAEWDAQTHRTAGLIGMFRSDKGHKHFVEAALRLTQKFPDARFVLVGGDLGSGNLRRELIERVKSAGAQKKILFYNFRSDMANFIASLDSIVIASTGVEAQSRVAPEAFAMKRPVIATRVGGVPELVRDSETGLLIPPGDPGAMAEAIEKTWEDRASTKRRVEQAYDFATRELNFDKKMNETLEVYRGAIQNPKSKIQNR